MNDIERAIEKLELLRNNVSKVVVGQRNMLDRLLLALLCGGHVLLEGVPGIAKTLTVQALASSLDALFSRIQFTPDLLPGDLLGTQVFDPRDASFRVEKGPVFANLLLADEINRAPAKVQSALLEAMQERQVTLGGERHLLPQPFLVLATQNPIEQEGTYPLPEAQVDRFMFKLKVDYPTMEEEHEIMRRMARAAPVMNLDPVLPISELPVLRGLLDKQHMDKGIELYILRLVHATRNPVAAGFDAQPYIRYGASPRASIYLALAARGQALLKGRDYVVPQDVKDVVPDVLRHRLSLTYKAEVAEITSDDLIDRLLGTIALPGNE